MKIPLQEDAAFNAFETCSVSVRLVTQDFKSVVISFVSLLHVLIGPNISVYCSVILV